MTTPSMPAAGEPWARHHWQTAADRLLAGAARHRAPGTIRFPGAPTPVSGLEGLARTFMLAGMRMADDPAAVDRQWWAEALSIGADPHSTHPWPRIAPHGQEMVEAAGLVLGLHVSRESFWDELPQRTRDHVVDWLGGARAHACADNNHVLFGALAQAFLRSVGADHDVDEIDRAFARIQDWYRGDGWYTDGDGRRYDHYIGWAMHLYPLFICQILGEEAAAATELFRGRLRAFLADYALLFDPAGRPLHQGRSLIYRWAAAAPFWVGELFEATPLTPGATRELTSRMLGSFVSAGALDYGVLGPGWYREFPRLVQSYSGPGSALWASKGFLGLLLPAEHRVWTAPAAPVPSEEGDRRRALPAPGWYVQSTASDGIVRVLNHGSDGHPYEDSDLYRRLAFSTVTGPEMGAGVRDNVVDVPVGGRPATHTGTRAHRVSATAAASCHTVNAGGREVVIDVVSVPLGPAEVRIARVSGCAGQPVRLSGWAVADEAPPEHERTAAAEEVRTGSGLRSLLAPLFGGELGVATSTGTNAFGEYSALPMLTVAGDQTEVRYVGAIVALTRTAWEPTELLRELEVDVRTGEVLVATATTRVLVPWAAPERLPGGISAAGGVPGQRMFSQRRPATEATSTARTRATSPPG